jgi:hypothetical protein
VDRARQREVAIEACLVVLGLALVIIAQVIRPLPSGTHPVWVIIAGSLPNFGAGLGMPFAGRLCTRVVGRWLRTVGRVPFWSLCGLTLAILVSWEYLSQARWALRVDPSDIIASVVGVLIAAALHRAVRCRLGAAVPDIWRTTGARQGRAA